MKRDLLILFALALLVRLLAALPQQQPNYMDAAYSYVNATNLAAGRGFVEDFVWNYLGQPDRPPQPSHLYWMPLTSILAWAGMLVGGVSYRAAQVPFILLSALLAPVSYIAAHILTGRRWPAWLAGLLAIFSGFYVPFWTAIDNFTPFGLAGSLALLAAYQVGVGSEHFSVPKALKGSPQALAYLFAAGVLAGLAHLARADGLLLLLAIWLAYVLHCYRAIFGLTARMIEPPSHQNPKIPSGFSLWLRALVVKLLRGGLAALRFTVPLLLGYLLIMAPWFIRNWQVAGAPLPAAGSQTIWLPTGRDLFSSYNYLFSYGRELSARTFFGQGLGPILQGRWWVVAANLQTVLATWGMIFLTPLALVGGWRLRRHPLVQLAGLYGLLLCLAMTLVFAFPGALGGLFHSGAAMLPFVYAAALVGLETLVGWAAARRRRWDARLAARFFSLGLLLLAVLLSGFIYYRRVLKDDAWNSADGLYPAIAAWVAGQDPAATVMINNPPAYRYHGGGLSLVIPNETIETTLAAAHRYGVDYLVLEQNHPAALAAVYSPTFTHPGLVLVKTFGDQGGEIYVYRIH